MTDAITKLTEALQCLPGVGPKSAQRMVFHLLRGRRQQGHLLAACLQDTMETIRHCQHCNNYTADNWCVICQNKHRDTTLLCVVEGPADVAAIEQSHAYHGYYFVLMGKISPIDGVGPEHLGLTKLQQRVANDGIKEVILALSPTIEGQTTTHFIQDLLATSGIRISRPAHGIPSGGELEYLDGHTITNALRNRANISA